MRFTTSSCCLSGAKSLSSAGRAPYPACTTASTICSGEATLSSKVTFSRPSIRFTAAFSTPGTCAAARSTCAEQAAQVIPVTANCIVINFHLLTS